MKEVRKHNGDAFVKDFKRMRNILTYASDSCLYLPVTKKSVWEEAKTKEIKYYLSDNIYVVKRTVMVII